MNEKQAASASRKVPSFLIRLLAAALPALAYAIAAALLIPTDVNISEATPGERFVIQVFGGLFMYAIIFLVLMLLCVGVNRLFMSRKMRVAEFWLFCSIATICLLLIGFRGAWYVRQHDVDNRAQSAGVDLPIDATNVMTTAVSTQTSHGITDADMDLELLARLEDWTLNTIVEKVRLAAKDPAFKADEYRRRLNAQSVYLTIGGKKLAITKMRPPGTRIVAVTGIRGNELVRVLCVRDSDEDILVISGVCGSAIAGAFRVEISSL